MKFPNLFKKKVSNKEPEKELESVLFIDPTNIEEIFTKSDNIEEFIEKI